MKNHIYFFIIVVIILIAVGALFGYFQIENAFLKGAVIAAIILIASFIFKKFFI